jgi:ATP-dependent DNA helicase RecG
MLDQNLQTPVQFVRGVGPSRAELLNRLGLTTVDDLLFALPRDILDLSHISDAGELREGEVHTVRGRVVDLDGKTLTNGRTMCAVLLDCAGEYVRGVWFNQTWVLPKFKADNLVLFSGKPKRHAGRWEFSHPRVQWLDDDDGLAHGGVLPRYGLTEGLKMHDMRRIMRNAVEDFVHLVPEYFPAPFLKKLDLPAIGQALRGIHTPKTAEEYAAGRRRLILQDLLEFQLAIALRRRAWRRLRAAPKFPATAKIDSRIRRLLPFQLTAGQNQAVREIVGDLESGFAMHRLLQADVGAGKTVVALYAILTTVAAGHQAVLMAPTELLATQHWRTIDRLLSHSRVERLLLTGNLTPAERRRALDRIASGEVQLIVGTQAVIQKDVSFGKLGLVVIDEQHKFGVMQRAHFSAQGTFPHTLVMTATPIPRSLCLTQFGDLDLTVMKELPPGRQKVTTSLITTEPMRTKVWTFVRGKLIAGRQLYIVCPRIGSDDDSASPEDAPGAERTFRELSEGELKGFTLGLLHGRMDPERKAAAMNAFRAGQIQALVSTTVVEVGVDVPNATLMVILQAESFGLSQLHQLRGRISRGSFAGYCFLFSDSPNPDALARLQNLEKHADGFEVAEADFQLRGPGDVLGTRQHGDLPLKVADLVRDQSELTEARDAAFELVRSGEFDTPEFAPLKNQVLDRFGKLVDLRGGG